MNDELQQQLERLADNRPTGDIESAISLLADALLDIRARLAVIHDNQHRLRP